MRLQHAHDVDDAYLRGLALFLCDSLVRIKQKLQKDPAGLKVTSSFIWYLQVLRRIVPFLQAFLQDVSSQRCLFRPCIRATMREAPMSDITHTFRGIEASSFSRVSGLGGPMFSPPLVHLIWFWVFYNKIPIYPIF